MKLSPPQKTNDNYISAVVVRSLVTFLESKGINAHALLMQIDPHIDTTLNTTDMLDSNVYPQLLDKAIDLSSNPHLGLEFGMSAEPERWGVLGYIMSCCTTLNDAIECQLRYQDLVGSIGNVTSSKKGDQILMAWRTKTPPTRAIAEEAMAGWVAFSRWITATDHSPTAVFFSHAKPENTEIHSSFFKCPLHFNADFVGLSFPFALLQSKLKQPNSEMRKCLENHAEQKLLDLSKPKNILSQLGSYIEETLPKHLPSLSDAALALSLTNRTLQRRLSEENTSYSEFLKKIRHQVAKRHLIQDQHSLLDITFLLGFSEQSAFTRAFKNIEGISPNDFKKSR
ncbi:hypothetical protein A9Q99_00710 [Gammaproteobacteria bacterium 45_16_T64]|nr:hypothetical protein A9Q99_00710 [Gammaproteobacteria bacterium 45_16_T64]